MSRKGSANKQPENPPALYEAEDGWQFVNVSGRKENQSVQVRRMVRANATRAYWRAQRKRGLQSHTGGTSNSEGDNARRSRAPFVRHVHRNSRKACDNQEMHVSG